MHYDEIHNFTEKESLFDLLQLQRQQQHQQRLGNKNYHILDNNAVDKMTIDAQNSKVSGGLEKLSSHSTSAIDGIGRGQTINKKEDDGNSNDLDTWSCHTVGTMMTSSNPSISVIQQPDHSTIGVDGKKRIENNEDPPSEVLKFIFKTKGLALSTQSFVSLADHFVKGNVGAYTSDLMLAVPNNNVDKDRKFHQSGYVLQCCNKFGESIVHTAARRGNYDVLRYLSVFGGVAMMVCCDFWTATPNLDCIRLLHHECPSFFFITDKRGFTPLQYKLGFLEGILTVGIQ